MSTTYRVVGNSQQQHSIWPSDTPVPLGWKELMSVGTRQECLAYIQQAWRDIGPQAPTHTRTAAGAGTPSGSQRGEANTLVESLRRSVERTPDATAVEDHEQALTYAELWARVESFATLVRTRWDLRRDDIVTLLLPRSVDAIVALMGVMRAGAAYLPLDLSFPAQLVRDVLALADPRGVILDSASFRRIDGFRGDVMVLDLEWQPAATTTSPHSPDLQLHEMPSPESLAYLICTSGSTGSRKLVAVPHLGAANMVRWRSAFYEFDGTDVVLQVPSISFDSSVADIFAALASGAKLVMLSEAERRDPRVLAQKIERCQATNVLVTPTYYAHLVEHLRTPSSLLSVTVAGESLPRELARRHYARLSDTVLINEYGPTEATVCSTAARVPVDAERISVGRAIDGVEILVCDSRLQPMEAGQRGEICIAGSNLSWGYLRDPARTAELFVPDPRGGGNRMYRTGDIGWRSSSGEIVLQGRRDRQVKLRGFRVELGEVEEALLRCPGVRAACAVCRRNDDGQVVDLIAYLAGDTTDTSVRRLLATRLPAHALPRQIIVLDRLPRTVNGKLDVRALPEPGTSVRASARQLTRLEAGLIDVWKTLLDVQDVQANDDFFELGGNSLTAVHLSTLVHARFGAEISVAQIMTLRTIDALARVIDPTATALGPRAVPEQR